MTIEHLELNFQDPQDVDSEQVNWITPREKSDRIRWGPPLEEEAGGHLPSILDMGTLAQDLVYEIECLLRMGYHTATYGGILYERIGSISIKANGGILKEFDLAQMLADLRFEDSFGDLSWDKRLEAWLKWKDQVQKKRELAGLKTVEPRSDWEKQAQADADLFYARRRFPHGK